jgi:hypothetical protein
VKEKATMVLFTRMATLPRPTCIPLAQHQMAAVARANVGRNEHTSTTTFRRHNATRQCTIADRAAQLGAERAFVGVPHDNGAMRLCAQNTSTVSHEKR